MVQTISPHCIFTLGYCIQKTRLTKHTQPKLRSKFVEDLRESVAEMDEMEALRIEAELEKQHAGSSRVSVAGSTVTTSASGATDNRDSGVNDCDSQQSSTR